MMLDEQRKHIQNLLQINRSNLQRLEKQIAQHGGEMSAPLNLLSQRDEVLAEIERLENKLQKLRQRVEEVGLPETPTSGQPGVGTPAQVDLTVLHRKITRYFDREELRTLCFELDVDYDSLPAEGKAAKARELVQHCKRHGLTAKLIETCERLYPHVSWKES